MQYVLSVSEINKYIKELISRDLILSNVWVRGEISNYKSHYSGHMYFTLKDENCLIKCVMFKSRNEYLKFVPENGMKVIVKGYVSVFERDGQYQLYAEEMQPDGIGDLHMAFEQLKKRLELEGLFDKKYKKPIPYLPKSIGVVTSSTGSVIRDIINIVSRRFSNVELKLFPVAVQGESAPAQIAHGIKKLNELGCVDVIIVARGGGSLEELWAFNEEIVARSIFESKIPVISAVGHETDFTIADFVADLRAPTPSAAAELVVPERQSLERKIIDLEARLRHSILRNLNLKKIQLQNIQNSAAFRQPYDRIYQERMNLDILNKNLIKSIGTRMDRERSNLSLLIGKLNALSPLAILSRGYTIARNKSNDLIVKSISDVTCGDMLEVCVCDGKLECKVEKIQSTEVKARNG